MPCTDVLNLSFEQDVALLTIYTATGSLVATHRISSGTRMEQISTEALAPGHYIVELKSNNSTQYINLIKQAHR